jgi:hypothetical protein
VARQSGVGEVHRALEVDQWYLAPFGQPRQLLFLVVVERCTQPSRGRHGLARRLDRGEQHVAHANVPAQGVDDVRKGPRVVNQPQERVLDRDLILAIDV